MAMFYVEAYIVVVTFRVNEAEGVSGPIYIVLIMGVMVGVWSLMISSVCVVKKCWSRTGAGRLLGLYASISSAFTFANDLCTGSLPLYSS
jgi:hypothetical protein